MHRYTARASQLIPSAPPARVSPAPQVQSAASSSQPPAYLTREAEGDRLDKEAEVEFLAGRFAKALDLFKRAAAQFISAAEESPSNKNLTKKAEKAMRTYEKLDAQLKASARPSPSTPSPPRAAAAPARDPGTIRTRGAGDPSGYSPDEVKALVGTSKINGETYLPWVDGDRGEDFTNGMFTDPHGQLKLADSQKKAFKRWLRASDLTDNCTMIKKVTSHSIQQTVVGDCSFVCSLCVAADYERFFKIPLIVSEAIFCLVLQRLRRPSTHTHPTVDKSYLAAKERHACFQPTRKVHGQTLFQWGLAKGCD